MKHNKHFLIIFSALFILLFVGVVGVVGASFFVFKKINKKDTLDSKYSVVGSRELARKWVVFTSPTYNFDGSNLVFNGYKKLGCNFCYEFSFGFESKYPGYGNRIDDNLVSSTTAHIMAISSETGMISKVIIDGKYDEMKGVFIQEDKIDSLGKIKN
ncbi:MAG: hypothetical protein NUV64_01820 [Parcubacteria group bacterium]|nr:hypothetical protein [Parcubacteria group bacterium]MCR4342915.1 hypothetical protein [Patescibacteria group bacterium]